MMQIRLSICLFLAVGHIAAHDAEAAKGDFSDHPCRRRCQRDEPPMYCDYKLEVSWHTTMARSCAYCPNVFADCALPGCIPGSGTQRAVLVANQAMPGPSIEVCVGDRIRVTVVNTLQNGEGLSIHWQGLHQRKTPYMDGATMYTQCPIPAGAKFTYDFEADAAGTHFWHGSVGFHKADGLEGPIIVRECDGPHDFLFERDTLPPIFFQAWSATETALTRFPPYALGDGDFTIPQILLNGRMPLRGLIESTTETPLPDFPVPIPPRDLLLNSKYRYRLRIINGAFGNTPIIVRATGHNLVVIAADGRPLVPVVTRSVTIYPSERIDVVLTFTGDELDPNCVYFLNAMGVGDAAQATTFARIVYKDGKCPNPLDPYRASGGMTKDVLEEVNYYDWTYYLTNDGGKVGRKMSQLRSVDKRPIVEGEPDVKMVIETGYETVNDLRLMPIISRRRDCHGRSKNEPCVFQTIRLNNISHVTPMVPLITQDHEIPDDMFCNSDNRRCPADEFCTCINAVDIALGALVEIILVDTAISDDAHRMNLGMHLHGYHVRVVAMERVHFNLKAEEVVELDRQGKIERNLKFAPAKDTIVIPAGGFTAIRFVADNPGIWLFESTMSYNKELGMAMVLRVGKKSDLPHAPPRFPHCQASWEASRLELASEEDDTDEDDDSDDDESSSSSNWSFK